MPDLKPCPFCGREATTEVSVETLVLGGKTSKYIRFSACCPVCSIGMRSSVEANESFEEVEKAMQRAVNYWNSRTESVRHGEWKFKVIDGFVPDYDCVCSECGESGVPDDKFCRNCGAKMKVTEDFYE